MNPPAPPIPEYCLKCGRETRRTLRISKLFRRTLLFGLCQMIKGSLP